MTGPGRMVGETPRQVSHNTTLGPDLPDLLRALALAAIPVFISWLTRILQREH